MKTFLLPTRLHLFVVYAAGIVILLSHFTVRDFVLSWLPVVLCILASLARLLKVEGTTDDSHYTFSYVVYGFTFATLGDGTTLLVILVSYLVEWIYYRPPLSRQLFFLCTCFIATELAWLTYSAIDQGTALVSGLDVLGILLGLAVFAAINHWMAGMLLWRTQGNNFRRSAVFELFPFILNISLLYFGASLAIVWNYNPFAVLLLAIPAYFLYSALRVPALKRKTELDSKTGLFNHEYFKRQLDSELSRSKRFDRPLSVIIADLDLLRNINNTYGHLAGDEVLIGVAKAMKKSVRDYDVVSRFGGEEFAILLPETTLEQAYEKAEFFRKTIEAMEFRVLTSKTPIRATMSFGVAHRESLRQTSNEIVHNADLALYRSKLNGRNRTCAHTKNTNVDLTTGLVEPENTSAEICFPPPSTYVVETFMQPTSMNMSVNRQ